MKIYFYYIVSFLLIFSLSGCFEVIEEITLNDDGSGHITMTVNFSQSKTKLNSIMLMDSINDYKVPSTADIDTQIKKMVSEVKAVDGVSNVQYQTDFENYIFSVSCDFASIDVLNDIITHFVTSEVKARDLRKNKQFSYDAGKKIFKRNYHYNLAREIENMRKKDREVLDDASVTTIYRFESDIVSCQNKDAKISGSKKAIMLKVDAEDMITNKNNIKNTIHLK